METVLKIASAAIGLLVSLAGLYKIYRRSYPNVKGQRGPLDDFLEMAGAYAMTFFPIAFFFFFMWGVSTIGSRESESRRETEQAARTPVSIDRARLSPTASRIYDLGEVANVMDQGSRRDDALAHVVDLAIAEGAPSIAVRAGARMARGRGRAEILDRAAMASVRGGDFETARLAVEHMDRGTDKDETAEKVMAVIELPLKAKPGPAAAKP